MKSYGLPFLFVFAFVFFASYQFVTLQEKQLIVLQEKQPSTDQQETQQKVDKTNSSIKIGVITDIHKCEARSPGKITAERLRSFVDDVNEREVNFNVDLGDNIRYRMNKCDDDAPEELVWIIENLKTKAPLYHALSDHDVDDIASFEHWKKTTGTKKSFYSFDVNDFHIMVLDTVTGDGSLDPICEESVLCRNTKKEYEKRRDLLKNEQSLIKYLANNRTTKTQLEKEKLQYDQQLKTIRWTGKELALIEKRDKGSILPVQLEWIKNDLASTDKEKIIIFSDHPLFSYQGKRKLYEIINLDELAEVLQSSSKQIVSISGETHEWHEEMIDGIHYYLIGMFSESPIGSWAIFEWDEKGYHLNKIQR